MRHHRPVTAGQSAHLRAVATRIGACALGAGALLAGLQMWIIPASTAGAVTPIGIYAQSYAQPSYYGPGRVAVSAASPSASQYELQRIGMSTRGTADVFSLTIIGAANVPGLSIFQPYGSSFAPALELVKNPTPVSAADTCTANCTFNLSQVPSGWELDEFVNGGLVTAAGPATVAIHGDVVTVTIDTSTLTPEGKRVMADPTTDVQAGFITRAADGSGEEDVSNPYAIGSLTGLGSGQQVTGPWQGRLLGSQGLSANPCSGSTPLWFTYNPTSHQENVVFSQSVGSGVTVEGGGPDSGAELANFNTVVIQTSSTPRGGTSVSSIGVETNNRPLVPLPVIPENATVTDNLVSITLADGTGQPLVQPGGFVTAAVSIHEATGTCVYHFPIVPLSLFPIPKTPPVPTAVSSSFWLGGSAGIGIGAALLGLAALIGVTISRSHAHGAVREDTPWSDS